MKVNSYRMQVFYFCNKVWLTIYMDSIKQNRCGKNVPNHLPNVQEIKWRLSYRVGRSTNTKLPHNSSTKCSENVILISQGKNVRGKAMGTNEKSPPKENMDFIPPVICKFMNFKLNNFQALGKLCGKSLLYFNTSNQTSTKYTITKRLLRNDSHVCNYVKLMRSARGRFVNRRESKPMVICDCLPSNEMIMS